MKISASVYANAGQDLLTTARALDAHRIDYFHIDCNDDPAVFDDVARLRTVSPTPVDLHLITATPERYYEAITNLGIELVTFQYEPLTGPLQLPDRWTARLGLALTSDTDIEAFAPFADRFDFVLFMATTPGQSGGQFNKLNFQKIRAFRRRFPGKRIHVDGGVNGEVSFILRNMGVDASVSGSYLFKETSLGMALLNLRTHELSSAYQVRDFMRPLSETPCLHPAALTWRQVLECIEVYSVGFALVTETDGRLRGLISSADIRRGLLRSGGDLGQVAEWVNPGPLVIAETATVGEMLAFVKSFDFPITYLPVVNDQHHLTGCVTFLNLVKGEG